MHLCVFICVCVDLKHDWSLLLCIDGDTGAGHPGIGAQVPEPHIRVSEEGSFDFHLYDIATVTTLTKLPHNIKSVR